MEQYNSEYLTINYNKSLSLIEFRWKPQSAELSDDIIKSEFLKEVELCEKYNPKNLLINTKDFQYVITPELQEWTDNSIFPKYIEAGVKQIAIVVGEDIFANVSVEQTMDEENASTIQSEYFTSEEDAIEWLKE